MCLRGVKLEKLLTERSNELGLVAEVVRGSFEETGDVLQKYPIARL